jgi:hypothetical protein
MTTCIMMKTIKKRLNLYTKNILMGWGSCLFLEFTFVFFTSNKLDLNYNVHNSFISGFGFMVLCINCMDHDMLVSKKTNWI